MPFFVMIGFTACYSCTNDKKAKKEKVSILEKKRIDSHLGDSSEKTTSKLEDTINKGDTSHKTSINKPISKIDSVIRGDNLELLLNFDSIDVWEGYIQESKFNQMLLLGEYINLKNSYDVILKPKNDYDNNLQKFHQNTEDWENYFSAYLFFVNQEINDEPESVFDEYKYVFPQNVVSYRHVDRNMWIRVDEKRIASLSELGRYKAEVVTR